MDTSYRIQLISSDADFADQLTKMLLGFDIERVSSDTLMDASNTPDLVLIDLWHSSAEEGVSLCQDFKAKESSTQVPVIFIAAEKDPDMVIRGFQVGGTDCVKAPFSADELQIRIGLQLRVRELNERLVQFNEMKTINTMIETYNHEINNPLTIAMGFLDMFEPKDPKKHEAFEKVKGALDRIFEIVQNVGKLFKAQKLNWAQNDDCDIYDIRAILDSKKTGTEE